MANFEVLSLDPTTPQIRAPGAGDGYSVPRDMTFATGTTLNAPTTVVSVNTSTDALRITQVGAGNALLVEDSANPDATPTVITATGNVGIGTTSPAAKLDVAGTVRSNNALAFEMTGSASLRQTASGGAMYFDVGGGGSHGEFIWRSSSSFTTRMTLDSSGNLGLGVTPSAWGSAYKNIDINTYAAVGSTTGVFALKANAFFDGTSDKYKNSAAASQYYQSAGAHVWDTAPSGTAGNAITFTQRMTLDASGRLLIGATSSQGNGSRLQISGNTQCFGSTGGNALLCSTSYFNTNSSGFEVAKLDVSTGTNIYEGVFQFYTKDSGGTMAERARITAAGNLGIGATSPAARLEISASFANSAIEEIARISRTGGTSAYGTARAAALTFFDASGSTLTAAVAGVRDNAAGNFLGGLSFYTASNVSLPRTTVADLTQQMVLTSSGNLGIGMSSPVAKLDVSGTIQSTVTGSAYAGYFNYVGATGQGVGISSTGVGSSYAMFFFNNGVSVGNIYLTSTTTTYNTSSDRRLKNNIAPSPSASNVIDAIEIVSHGWKAAPDKRVTYGVIAQDLAKVAPEAVTAGDDGEEVKQPWGVDYSKLVPMLIKEMQSLRKRVAELEAR